MRLERGRRIHHPQRRQGLLQIQLTDHRRGCKTFPTSHQIESGFDRLIVAVAHQRAQDTRERAEKLVELSKEQAEVVNK